MEPKPFLKILGERIRTLRKAKKISQERLAELSSLHPTYISNMEQGKVNASIYSYYKVANALEIPLSELVNIPKVKVNTEYENELIAIISQLRSLDKKQQVIFLSALKGLLSGIEKSK